MLATILSIIILTIVLFCAIVTRADNLYPPKDLDDEETSE